MPIDFRVDVARRCVFATAVPPVTDVNVIEYQLALAAHPDHGVGFDQLCDMRGSEEAVMVTAQGVRAAGEVSQLYRQHLAGTKLAIIVSDEIPMSVSLMLAECLTDLVDVRVFTDVGPATSWLRPLDESGDEPE